MESNVVLTITLPRSILKPLMIIAAEKEMTRTALIRGVLSLAVEKGWCKKVKKKPVAKVEKDVKDKHSES